MKKRLGALMLVFGMLLGAGGALAATNSETIQAMLSYGTTIKYNGQEQKFTDANGKPVYPIIYEGTTYLPVRAVSGLVGLAVDWDGATSTVYLGEKDKTPVAADMITGDYSVNFTTDKAYLVVDNQAHDSGILFQDLYGMERKANLNLAGKYSSLSFLAYNPHSEETLKITVYGKDNTVLKTFELSPGASSNIELTVSGQDTIKIAAKTAAKNVQGVNLIFTDIYLK